MKSLLTKKPLGKPLNLLDPDRQASRDSLLHERVVLCARLARLLRRFLRGFDWNEARPVDRARLQRVLSSLGADIPLIWLIDGQAAAQTEKTR